MTTTTADITDRDGDTVVANVDYDEIQYGFVLDGPGSAVLSIDMWKPQATAHNFLEGEREMYIYRDSELAWAGIIWSQEGGTEDGTVRVSAEGWYSALDGRLVTEDTNFSDEEQLDIAWRLINDTQDQTSGDLGITRDPGESPSGVTRTIKYRYWERRVVSDAINELASMNGGFDFQITPGKVWKTYYPRKGGDIAPITFTLDENVGGIYILRDAREVATEVHAIGGGEGKATCIAVATNPARSAAYELLQRAVDFADIKHFDTLMRKAERYLGLHKSSTRQPQLSLVTEDPAVGTFDIGDRTNVYANAGWFNIDGVYRIIAYEIQPTQAGREVITIHFDERLTP